MTNETEKKEPKSERESTYVTRAELEATLRKYAKDFSEAVTDYLASYTKSLEVRPRSEHAEYHGSGRDIEAEHALKELKTLLGTDALQLEGKSPLYERVATLYILMEHRKERVTQSLVAHTYGLSETTLRQHIKRLKNLMKSKRLKLSIRYFAPENAT